MFHLNYFSLKYKIEILNGKRYIDTSFTITSSSSPPIMQPSSSSSNYTYTKQQFIRDVLELARQRLSVESELKSKRMLNTNAVNFMEIIVGVGYMLLVLSFLVKIFLKTLGRFESHFASSHGNSNRFGFITNEDSDYESYSSSESDLDRDDTEDEEEDEDENEDNDVDSPISLRPTLSVTPVKHVPPMTTPMQSINVDTPQTPYPPAAALRRSMRLKIKSELNLTSIEKQNQNRTHIVTRSQTQQNENITISSAPPLSHAAFRPNHNSTVTPSAHPENDEELAFILRLHNENRMKRRSRFNSPLVVRRLVL